MRILSTTIAIVLLLSAIDVAPAQAPAAGKAAPASIHVRLPANAMLTINGDKTNETGEERWFITPPLDPGKKYSATLKIHFVRDGNNFTIERKVALSAGRVAHAHFLPKETFGHLHEPLPGYPAPPPPVIVEDTPLDWDFY